MILTRAVALRSRSRRPCKQLVVPLLFLNQHKLLSFLLIERGEASSLLPVLLF